ncbi:attacin-B-like [Periplaneta americana]|uniref:attacin-B-like n=1 Tax=Periplaneta americana TaxID=6978 RepID=UPI0037E8F39E
MKLLLTVVSLIVATDFVSSYSAYRHAPYELEDRDLVPKDYYGTEVEEQPLQQEENYDTLSSEERMTDPQEYNMFMRKAKIRAKRQLTTSITRDADTGVTKLEGGIQRNLINRGPHSLDVNGFISKSFGPSGRGQRPVFGGGLSYMHSNRGGAEISVSRQNPFGGTELSAKAQGNLYRSRNGRTNLDANFNYSRRFGGPFGSSRPSFGGGLTLTHRF